MNNFISASIIAADFWNLEREYKELNKTKVEWIHYDIMDGHFVPNITIGSCELDSLVNKSNIAIDIHFMVSNPDYIVPYFVEKYKGTIVKNITVHSEVCINVKKLSEIVRKNGINFGLAIKPKTSINRIVENIGFIDLALVMTVEPGFAGQSLIKSCLKKICLDLVTGGDTKMVNTPHFHLFQILFLNLVNSITILKKPITQLCKTNL